MDEHYGTKYGRPMTIVNRIHYEVENRT